MYHLPCSYFSPMQCTLFFPRSLSWAPLLPPLQYGKTSIVDQTILISLLDLQAKRVSQPSQRRENVQGKSGLLAIREGVVYWCARGIRALLLDLLLAAKDLIVRPLFFLQSCRVGCVFIAGIHTPLAICLFEVCNSIPGIEL